MSEYVTRTTTAITRRTILKASGALLVAAAGAMQFAHASDQPMSGGHLRLALGGGASTDTLDPAKSLSQVCLVTHRNWGDTLVETDPATGVAVSSLAESWSSSPDAKVWTFVVRKGVVFHDGRTVSVDDCAETLLRHMDPESQSVVSSILKIVKSVEKKDGNLVITLDSGNADFPLLLSDFHLVIQPGGGRDNPAAGVGTGPYKIVDWEPGVRATFEKNKNDWRSDRGHVESIEILVVNDASARFSALASGQVDFVNLMDPKTITFIKRTPNVELLVTKGRGHYTFGMHCDVAPFDNNDVRLALKYAIDRNEMVEKVLSGYGEVGNDFPINALYPMFPADIEARAYDPDKAAFHLKKSGYDGPIPLCVADVAFPSAVDAALLFQSSCEKAGIKLDVQRMPNDGYWSDVWNKKPFTANYWGGRPTQDQQYTLAYLSTADWNDTHFRNPQFDKLLLEARAQLDDQKRMEMYRSLALLIRDDGGVIVPMFNNFLNASSKRVKGFVHDTSNDMSNGYVCSRIWLSS